MAKKPGKDKNTGSKYKYLRPEEVEELERASTAELLKMHMAESKNHQAARRQKKEDQTLKSLGEQIKKHREENTPEEVKTLKLRIKELKEEVDEDISEILEDKKALNKGFNDTIKAFGEKVDVILKILAKRNQ